MEGGLIIIMEERKEWRQGCKELIWMAVPGLAGMCLFVWGLKVCEWTGRFCLTGGILTVTGAILVVLSLYIYWWTDFRGKQGDRGFLGLFISTAGTAVAVLLLTRFLN
ncbi:MAG: hypothetical protein JXA49_04890 [Actinobacteria bacterium]|nr:hypothetical protein [Actinomycetota bacterium]